MPELIRALAARVQVDGPALVEAARDFGRLIERRPLAVVRPESERDVEETLRLARAHRVGVAARGCGHSTHGQSQAHGGIVVDLRTLNRIEVPHGGRITVEAGARWDDVLRQTLPRGLTPPVLTDFLGLTVGGTLSAGGVGVQTFRHGIQAEHVLELRVVTGSGETLTCSPEQHPELFQACLAGLGQCGIIVRATLRLVPAPKSVHVQRLVFAGVDDLLGALDTLAAARLHDGLQASLAENDPRRIAELFGAHADVVSALQLGGTWLPLLATVSYDSPPPADALPSAMLLGARALPPETMSYFQFVARCRHILEPGPDKFGGIHDCPHPWLNLLLPADRCAGFVGRLLPEIDGGACGRGPVLLIPLRGETSSLPLFRTPAGPRPVKISLLKNLLQPTSQNLDAALASNRRLYDACLANGGTRYPIDSLPMSPADWARHFGPAWPAFQRAKARWDPAHVLGVGEGIFPAPAAAPLPA